MKGQASSFPADLQKSMGGVGELILAHVYQRWDAQVQRSAAEQRLELMACLQNQDEALDNEFANIRQSRSWLAQQQGEENDRLQLAYIDLFAPYLLRSNRYTELLHWCEDGLCACERLQRNQGELYLLKGRSLNALGYWTETRASYEEAMRASEGRDPSLYAQATLALGQLQFNQGLYPLAIATLEKAEKLLSELDEHDLLASIHAERAAYYLNKGDLEKALALYLEVERRREQAGKKEDANLLMLGVIYRKRKEYGQAQMYLQRLLTFGEEHRDRGAIATASHHLAWVAHEQGDVLKARALCGKALALYNDLVDQRGISDALEQLGRIDLVEGRLQEALSPLQQSLMLRQELQNRQGAASSLSHLTIAYLRLGKFLLALWTLWRSLVLYQRIGMLSRYRMKTIARNIVLSLGRSWRWAK